MMNVILYIILGFGAGVLSGLIGIGGGILILPVLVFAFKLTQHEAQGTTLAMLIPPIGIFAVWQYYKKGFVHFDIAGYLCLGFLFGGLLGAKLANAVSDLMLGRIFGIALFIISIKMIIGK
jgi:uncharacterized membrane protein YfcA